MFEKLKRMFLKERIKMVMFAGMSNAELQQALAVDENHPLYRAIQQVLLDLQMKYLADAMDFSLPVQERLDCIAAHGALEETLKHLEQNRQAAMNPGHKTV